MSSNRMRRIAKEIEDVKSDSWSKVTLNPALNADDLTHLEGVFHGPPDTPYEGGTFHVDIRIPADYPFRPPQMKFKTRIWHPNVSSQTGAICLDTLSTNWSPVLTIKSALISLQGLLASPEPKDPQDAEVASMMLKSPQEFEHVASEWTVKYAGAPPKRTSESSGGTTQEQLIARAKARQEEAAKVRPDRYASLDAAQ
ncbi:hypothetical protein FH972_023512 [Carpinus fangiana]|uniref:E2 ubiquitin-conjugating enzyme n=1 Tax=Carpinus fangiana TaxID=176857 RepID=A0A5N6KVS1_9ROSI|nr:hypothetical protein FH972_023512 [Carpinus fangiana]